MELLTLEEAAEYLKCSKSKLYKLTSTKKIEFIKLFDGAIRFNKATLVKMIERCTVKPMYC